MVLRGAGCRVDFEKAVFEGTTLVVMNGAKAKLNGCRFLAAREQCDHLHLYVHGTNFTWSSQTATSMEGNRGSPCIMVSSGSHE